jgi:hypothetical protein
VGTKLRETLDAALGEVRFLIPILTPSFFRDDDPGDRLVDRLRRADALGGDAVDRRLPDTERTVSGRSAAVLEVLALLVA